MVSVNDIAQSLFEKLCSDGFLDLGEATDFVEETFGKEFINVKNDGVRFLREDVSLHFFDLYQGDFHWNSHDKSWIPTLGLDEY